MLVDLHTFQKAILQVWIENRIFLFADSADNGSTGNTCETQFRKKATANWLRQCLMRYEKDEVSYTPAKDLCVQWSEVFLRGNGHPTPKG